MNTLRLAKAAALWTVARFAVFTGRETLNPSRALRTASFAEATTLAVLVFIAAPLKHLAGAGDAVRLMGPLHGMTFLLYLWTLLRAVGAGGWRAGETARMIVVACIPLAGFINQAWLARKLRSLSGGETNP